MEHSVYTCVYMCMCVYVCVYVYVCSVTQWCPNLCDPMDYSPPGSSVHEIFLGRITGVDCHFLLQGVFTIQGSNPRLLHFLHYRCILYH